MRSQYIARSKLLWPNQTNLTITTDALKIGYCGNLGSQFCQGPWSVAQKKIHIYVLESDALYFSLKRFQIFLRGQNDLVTSDSTTVVQYLNKQGGTKSHQMCYGIWDLWKWAIKNMIHIKEAHI